MKILLSHSGKQHSYWVAKALHELNLLSLFQTSVYISRKILQSLLFHLGGDFWSRRYIDGLFGHKVSSHWRYEIPEMLLRIKNASHQRIFDAICVRDEKFDAHIASGLSDIDFDVFWGFQGSSYLSITKAKELGKLTICEQSAVYFPTYSALYQEEVILKPEWSQTIRPIHFLSTYQKRLIEEPLVADYVIAASNFTRQSLIAGGVGEHKILVQGLGFDASTISIKQNFRTRESPFKVLFVGRLTQEKGLSYLLDAVSSFSSGDVELHLIGGGWFADHPLNKYLCSNIILHKAVSQSQLWGLYKEYDLLVLPSLSEGFGMVIVEALAAGLPVISSCNTIGNDIISNGLNGFVVPIRDVESIKSAILEIKSLSEEKYMAMSNAARQSIQLFNWKSYKERLETSLNFIRKNNTYREKKFILSHSGKQHSYYVARGLKRNGCLERFYTSGYLGNERLQTLVHKYNNSFWSRRFLDGLSGRDVASNWRFEIKEYLLRCWEGKSKRVQEAVYERDVKFDSYTASQLSKSKYDVFWGFQGSCKMSLTQAKLEGKITICELATAHVCAAKDILGQEALLHPEWADSIDNLVFPDVYEKRLEAEPHIADYCIVASDFSKKTLLDTGIAPSKIYKIPLGFDINYVSRKTEIIPLENRPLKLLYAGTVTQRKGIFYLLEAMKHFSRTDVELHIIGGIQGSGSAFNTYKSTYIKNNPISQLEMFRTYKDYDALVLPSIFEGFGLVIVEAMAAGLPVITTNHSIGPELIKEGESGYIVPIRDIEAIRRAILSLRNLSTNEYKYMSDNAVNAASFYSWDKYDQNLKEFLKVIS